MTHVWKVIENLGIEGAAQNKASCFIATFVGGVLLGIAYLGFIIVVGKGSVNPGLMPLWMFLGALSFGIGLLLCAYAFGQLVTANFVYSGSFITQHKSIVPILIGMVLGFIGNFAGSVVIAALAHFANIISHDVNIVTYLTNLTTAKCEKPIHESIFSGIFTSVILIAVFLCKKIIAEKAVALVISILLVFTFIYGGYQHTVANMFLISFAGFENVFAGHESLVAKAFYNCLLGSFIGNFLGSFLFCIPFYLGYKIESQQKKPKQK